jgi:hypothetical protein
MIKANIAGRRIAVTFQHGSYTPGALSGHEVVARRYTKALVWELGAKPEDRKLLTEATVRCYFKDKMTREDGRKKALKQAFQKLPFSAEQRKQSFWPAYFARFSDQKNPLKA